ncbi:MAG: glucosaminidase domain-containing protein [Hyphomicrobiaceae bacterium]
MTTTVNQKVRAGTAPFFATVTIAAAALVVSGVDAMAQRLPEIRMTARNQVPACVTPDRMMRFLADRNSRLLPKFRHIAHDYRRLGEQLRIRWDYAFFQMIVETNYLKFKNNAGQGDVSPRQNNFAGIGTTGGGVPGNSFPDVPTGVLAQLQHLTAYSGVHVANPVATRTRDKQDDIISQSRRLRRPVTFRDLSRRWAVDRRYWRSIESIASRYRSQYCRGRDGAEERQELAERRALNTPQRVAHRPAPNRIMAAGTWSTSKTRNAAIDAQGNTAGFTVPIPRLAQRPPAPALPSVTTCRVFTASYGGTQNMLIRQQIGSELRYTALQVLDGREQGLASTFIRQHAPGGEAVALFPDRQHALQKAFSLCPSAAYSAG